MALRKESLVKFEYTERGQSRDDFIEEELLSKGLDWIGGEILSEERGGVLEKEKGE